MNPDQRITISNDELFTVRDAMRELNRIVDRIESGEIEKAVLVRRGKMVAVVAALPEWQRTVVANFDNPQGWARRYVIDGIDPRTGDVVLKEMDALHDPPEPTAKELGLMPEDGRG